MSSPKCTELDISKRTLPPLPITKRKLPTLPQSKSALIHNNKCEEEKKPAPNPSILSHSDNESDPRYQFRRLHTHKSTTSFGTNTSRSLRNLFSNLQQKMGGSKTRLQSKIPYKIAGKMQPKNDRSQQVISCVNHNKSKWRPTLQFICKKDEELLNALITFMTRQFNEENILFLRSINELNNNINRLLLFKKDINIVGEEKINVEILSIYNKYIANNAIKQINLSSQCFNNINYTIQTLPVFERHTLKGKKSIFNECIAEIENLILNSIMAGFYSSAEFQTIAQSRNLFNNSLRHRPSISMPHLPDNAHFATVCFDAHSVNHWNEHNKYMLSPNAFCQGIHEWTVRILECNALRQEIGIVSNFNTDIQMNEYGVCETASFGPRAVYGYNQLIKLNKHNKIVGNEHHFYYESYNRNNAVRCSKDLSQLDIHREPWSKGDIIKVCLNLNKGVVKFYLNGKQVRKTVSIERNVTYFPIILYSGDCRYEVI